jgi:hypothetical protein
MRKLTRMEVAQRVLWFSGEFHNLVEQQAGALVRSGQLTLADRPFGLNLGYGHVKDHKFAVHQVRPVRRQGPDGLMKQDLLIQITQRRPAYLDDREQANENQRYMAEGEQPIAPRSRPDFWYRGGVTLILDLESFEVRYSIGKDVVDPTRLDRQRQFLGSAGGTSLRELYFGSPDAGQRLSLLHLGDD